MQYKRLLAFIIMIFPVVTPSPAQIINIKKTAENAAINQSNQTINSDINTGVNAVFQAPGKIFRKVRSNAQQSRSAAGNNQSINATTAVPLPPSADAPGKVTNSSDFISANRVILIDDFSSNDPGDFPEQWITNGSGEVRAVDNQEGKWLQFSTNGVFAPNGMKDLPDNFTLEYDAIFNPDAGADVHYIFYLYSISDKIADFKETNYPGKAGIYFAFNTHAGEVDAESFENGKAGIIDLHLVTNLIKSALANKVHVAISRKKSKLSLYINGNKIFSSPTALPTMYTYNAIKFGSFYMGDDDFMLISTLRIATD